MIKKLRKQKTFKTSCEYERKEQYLHDVVFSNIFDMDRYTMVH